MSNFFNLKIREPKEGSVIGRIELRFNEPSVYFGFYTGLNKLDMPSRYISEEDEFKYSIRRAAYAFLDLIKESLDEEVSRVLDQRRSIK